MKKILMTCAAIAALFAIAGSASAITCTIDQRPAATLLVPYFEVSFAPDGTPIGTGPSARDTFVTICNASSAPMIAHANVFNERTQLVLDFNIALTGFDCQSMSMARVLSGFLPRTGADLDGDDELDDVCQKTYGTLEPDAPVYPNPNGFLRVNPTEPSSGLDNNFATTLYSATGAWPFGSSFAFELLDSLDETDDTIYCEDGIDRVIENPIRGYMTIDHANYCNLTSPEDSAYYSNDAIGMENNLFGEVIFTSGSGAPTFGNSTVNIEAATNSDVPGLVNADNPGRPFEHQTDTDRARTFYARYWAPTDDPSTPGTGLCPNCVGAPLPDGTNPTNLFLNSPWNIARGDAREPLGLKYAARWWNSNVITSNLNVWRGSSNPLANLTGSPGDTCDDILPDVSLVFFDEDENGFSTSGCTFSPCNPNTPGGGDQFPFETQRKNITSFASALPTPPAGSIGWVSMSFFNPVSDSAFDFDQAWVEYDLQGPGAFLSAGQPATQLDPTTCNPLQVTGVQSIQPVIPAIVGTGP